MPLEVLQLGNVQEQELPSLVLPSLGFGYVKHHEIQATSEVEIDNADLLCARIVHPSTIHEQAHRKNRHHDHQAERETPVEPAL